jgi:putative tryptophan/tyrosine transport system substrate-binding protein
MDRRRFLQTSLAGVLAAPLGAEAQQTGKVYRIGYLGGTGPAVVAPSMAAFRDGLRALGWIEGQGVLIDERWAEGKAERLSGLAAELVRLKVDVIVTPGSPATRVAKDATATIPIVMVNTTDPVSQGFIASLARPGGNVTGSSDFAGELSQKRLELLKEALPKVSRVAVLFDPSHPAHAVEVGRMRSAAETLGVVLQLAEAASPEQFQGAFMKMREGRAEALIVLEGFLNVENRTLIMRFAASNRLPLMSTVGYTRAGGLMSYTPDLPDMYRRAAGYVHKILKGAKPADLPVEQPTKLLLVLNLNTARALGLTIPPSVLARADEIIDP